MTFLYNLIGSFLLRVGNGWASGPSPRASGRLFLLIPSDGWDPGLSRQDPGPWGPPVTNQDTWAWMQETPPPAWRSSTGDVRVVTSLCHVAGLGAGGGPWRETQGSEVESQAFRQQAAAQEGLWASAGVCRPGTRGPRMQGSGPEPVDGATTRKPCVSPAAPSHSLHLPGLPGACSRTPGPSWPLRTCFLSLACWVGSRVGGWASRLGLAPQGEVWSLKTGGAAGLSQESPRAR